MNIEMFIFLYNSVSVIYVYAYQEGMRRLPGSLPYTFSYARNNRLKFVQDNERKGSVLMIHADNLIFSYDYAGAPSKALDDVTFSVKPGEFIAILGHNGCGKSTLAKHLNALLPLQSGSLTVAGLDAANPRNSSELRRKVGMVFQNPDNQFVSTVIEEDVAFGLRNYDIPEEIIETRVKEALHLVDMDGYEKRAPHSLSGGQKQRIALAGVLAMDPELLVLDEVTSMLDPEGQREVLSIIRRLQDHGKTIIMITHEIKETLYADRILLMQDGKILADGTPHEILTDTVLLAQTSLRPPMPVQVYLELNAQGFPLPDIPLTREELVAELLQLYQQVPTSDCIGETCPNNPTVTRTNSKGGEPS